MTRDLRKLLDLMQTEPVFSSDHTLLEFCVYCYAGRVKGDLHLLKHNDSCSWLEQKRIVEKILKENTIISGD